MAVTRSGTKRRWLGSFAGAAAVVAVALMLFRLPPTKPVAAPAARSDSGITVATHRADELAMRDLAPLFLPTRYNATPTEVPHREPGGEFFEDDARRLKLKFSVTDPKLDMPAPFQAPTSPIAAVADNPGPLAFGFGRTDVTVPPLVAHAAHLEVFAADSGERVLTQTLPTAGTPKMPDGDSAGWQPMEFLASVDAAGLVGPLVLTTGSGVDEIDNGFRRYLAETFRIGDRLTPGFYRIVVGP